MRILYSHYLAADDHPAARMVHAVAAGLRARGHDVHVHRSAGPPAPGHAGPAAPPSRAKRLLWFAREMARDRGSFARDRAALEAFRPDVVLCRQDAYRVSMTRACHRVGVPVVTYADAPVAYEARHVNPAGRWHPPGLAERIERWGLRRSRGVVTVSRTAARLLAGYRLDVPVTVAPNGVDVERFRPRPAGARPPGVTTAHAVGFVGTFRPFHGLALLGELIRQSSARRSDVTWLLIGDGPGRADLERRTAGCANVRFLGRVPVETVSALLPQLDVLVSPRQTAVPEFYFSPLKILEGMAAGVACRAADQGDVPDLLDHGRAGRLVAGTDPTAWADALDALLDHPAERAARAAAARRRAVEGFTWDHTAVRVEGALREAVSRSDSRSETRGETAPADARAPTGISP